MFILLNMNPTYPCCLRPFTHLHTLSRSQLPFCVPPTHRGFSVLRRKQSCMASAYPHMCTHLDVHILAHPDVLMHVHTHAHLSTHPAPHSLSTLCLDEEVALHAGYTHAHTARCTPVNTQTHAHTPSPTLPHTHQ